MQSNRHPAKKFTHEGAVAKTVNAHQQLKRSVLSCLLFEKEFYESGQEIAERINSLAHQCTELEVSNLAINARNVHGLRHAPLILTLNLIKRQSSLATHTISQVIQRADELAELTALYWADGRKMLPRSMRRGLSIAFNKFNEYQFAKYNREREVKLRDVLFMSHAKPKNDAQAAIFKKIANNELSPPDTWEVRLSGGEDKKSVFTDLLARGKLGYLALLRNIRKMLEVGVNPALIEESLMNNKSDRILPYQFVAAAQFAPPRMERCIESAMLKNLQNQLKIKGTTALLVDVSGSMSAGLSTRSEMTRMDAAFGLSILLASICENLRVVSFSQQVVEVPSRQGFALRDAIKHSQARLCTYLGRAVQTVDQNIDYDRLIVITDEQSHDRVPDPKGKGYMINVASAKNGVGYGPWLHIDGFSQSVVKYIQEMENEF